MLASLLLLIVVVMLTMLFTHKPRAIWNTVASVNFHLPPLPTASARFNTLPPGANLPSESECAARVRRADEILQRIACKWGIDEDIVRAEAATESYWYQCQLGDLTTKRSNCPPGTSNGEGCYRSYDILQLKDGLSV